MTNQYIKAVLFDLDGTLIDTAHDFVRIIDKMCQQNYWQTPSETTIREQVSAGASAMVKLMLAHNDQPVNETQIQKYREQFLESYEHQICINSRVFDKLDTFLAKLESQGTPWGIVTNKPRHLAIKLLKELELFDRCDALVCPEDVRHNKPDPEPMYLAMEKLGLPRGISGSVIYVGDHIRDIAAGNAAGMITVLAAYGYIPPEDRNNLAAWQADYVCDTPKELVKLLKSKQFDYI